MYTFLGPFLYPSYTLLNFMFLFTKKFRDYMWLIG
jgi:hypothetical protein